ncbi:hypothetical protein NOZE110980_18590 [Nocardioides zeicaulis]
MDVAPGGVGLQSVVRPAQRGEVRGRGRAWLRLPGGCCVVVERRDVVEVADPGGAGAPREDAGSVTEDDLFAGPVGDRVGVGGELGVEVEDGSDGDLGAGRSAPALDLVEEREALAVVEPCGGPEDRVFTGGGGVEVDVEHDLPRCRQVVTGRGRGGRALGVEVERGLGAGEVTERGGTSGAERGRRAQRFQGRGTVLDGGVEVVGVGEVELGLHAHEAVVVDVSGVEGDVTAVGVEVLVGFEVLVVLTRGEVGPGLEAEVVPLDRLRDEPVELRSPDLPRDGCDLGVDPPRCFGGERGHRVNGGLGDQSCPPRRDPAGVHLRPQARQAVPQLEGVADELLCRGGRDPEDGAELGDAELRHQRTPLAGDGLLVVQARHGERGGVVDRLGRVQVGPAGSEVELTCSSGILCPALATEGRKQVSGGEVGGDLARSESTSRVDHVFDSRRRVRQSSTARGLAVNSREVVSTVSDKCRWPTSSTNGQRGRGLVTVSAQARRPTAAWAGRAP